MQTAPISISVAVPLFQHSPMFGQIDSSQTVASRWARTVARRFSKRSPLGSRAFNQGGFGSRGTARRSSRALTPFLIAVKPCSVWYLEPVAMTGMPRNSSILPANISYRRARVSHVTRIVMPATARRVPKLEVHHPGRRRRVAPRARRALAREAPGGDEAVSEAAAQGDRSENAEYIYGKKQLAEIDRRVRFLRKRLTGIHVVDQQPSDTTKVYFGAWFELRADAGASNEYRLVGPDEAGFAAGNTQHGFAARSRRDRQGVADTSSCARPRARRATPSWACATAEHRDRKKMPGTRPGESQGET